MPPDADLAGLSDQIASVPKRHRRRLVALAGPPASGKSTLAGRLAASLDRACVVPMDGFHLDNSLLRDKGLLMRKGAPDTFDVAGLRHLLGRLQTEEEVICPLFDRSLDRAIAGAAKVGPDIDTIIVEGNYLLLDADPWRALHGFWDASVMLSVPLPVLRKRLMARWRDHGYAPAEAQTKVETNDLPNARLTLDATAAADFVIEMGA